MMDGSLSMLSGPHQFLPSTQSTDETGDEDEQTDAAEPQADYSRSIYKGCKTTSEAGTPGDYEADLASAKMCEA